MLDRVAVGQRPQLKDARQLNPRHLESPVSPARREKELRVVDRAPRVELDTPSPRVNPAHGRWDQLDVVVLVPPHRLGQPAGLVLLGATTVAAVLLGQDRAFDYELVLLTRTGAVLVRLAMRRWSWLGAQLFAAATLGSVAYLLYAAAITYVVGRDPVYLVASSLLLILEIAALSLSMSYIF